MHINVRGTLAGLKTSDYIKVAFEKMFIEFMVFMSVIVLVALQ